MGAVSKSGLDDLSWRLLDALQEDGRMSYAEIGRKLGLSPPAVAERMRRLEDLGVVTGYRPVIDRARLGRPITAFIRLRTPSENYPRIDAFARERPEVLECHHVTGEDSHVFKVACASIQHLDRMILRLAPFGPTTTTIVLSTQAEGEPIARESGE